MPLNAFAKGVLLAVPDTYPGTTRQMDCYGSLQLIQMVTFAKKLGNMKSATYEIAPNGHCLIKAETFTQIGDYCDSDNSANGVIVMLDTGASKTHISRKLTEFLKLKLHKSTAIERGFDKEVDKTVEIEYSGLAIGIPELSYGNILHVIVKKYMPDFDIVLGTDYLNQIKFERNGPAGTFTLSIEQ